MALAGAGRLLHDVRLILVVECTHGREQVTGLLDAAGCRLFDPRRDFEPVSEAAYDTLAVPEGKPLP